MQSMVAIKPETPVVSQSSKSKAGAAVDGAESFSSEFDKHLSASEPVQKQSTSNSSQKSSNDETVGKAQEETASEDGNNLPVTNQDEAETEQIEKNGESSAETAQTSDEAADDLEEQPLVMAESTILASDMSAEPKANNQTDKTVVVDEHAVEHAKTQQVTMVARQQTEVVAATSSTETLVAEPVEDSEQVVATNQPVKKVTELPTDTALKSTEQTRAQAERSVLKPVVEQSAVTPAAQAEKTAETVAPIRADILNAIKKPQLAEGEPGVQMTAKNQLAAQMQTSSSASELHISKDALLAAMEGKTDKVSPLLTTPTAGPLTPVANSTLTGSSPLNPTTSAAMTSLDIQPTVQSAAWSKVMTSRVVWMAKEGIQQAELKLKPANMGPVEVRLHVQNDQVSVTFLAQHATTREALEQALPKLRESFAENGIELANAEVGAQHQQEQQHEHTDEASSAHIFSQANGSEDDIEIETEEIEQLEQQTSGLSLYA